MNKNTSISESHAEERLHLAMDGAIKQFEITMGEPLNSDIYLSVNHDPEFAALVEQEADKFRVSITTGAVDTLDLLWSESLRDPDLLRIGNKRITDDVIDLTHVSLVWLCLHELMHIRLGHFELTGETILPETGRVRRFSLTRMQEVQPVLAETLTPQEHELILPCTELQADYQAIDILLDVYADDRWDDLRMRAACIYAVMALIEREDRRYETLSTSHPMSSTRFFMMLGHLFQMWTYPGADYQKDEIGELIIPPEKPSPDDFQAYADAVLALSVNDAIALAVSAKAGSFLKDVSNDGSLLKDMLTFQYTENLRTDDLLSEGAKEWLRLLPVNEKLRAMVD